MENIFFVIGSLCAIFIIAGGAFVVLHSIYKQWFDRPDGHNLI